MKRHKGGEVSDSSLRDERLPKGPRFISESLDADTDSGSVLSKLNHYPDELAIVWQESEIAYRAIEQPLSEFLSRRNLSIPSESSALLVFIRQSCIAAMESHVRQDILREQAGIFCGQAYRDPSGQHYIEVTEAVAVQTLNSSSHFRFHEWSWQAVWETMGNDGNILGWYHSHPGMGIFLSATDLRTQELYFDAPWQIAVVLDPVSREIGAFHRDQRIPIHTIG